MSFTFQSLKHFVHIHTFQCFKCQLFLIYSRPQHWELYKKILCSLPLWGPHFRKKKKDILITPKINGDKEHHKNIYEVFWTQMREHLIWTWAEDGSIGQRYLWKESGISAGLAYLIKGVTDEHKGRDWIHTLRWQHWLRLRGSRGAAVQMNQGMYPTRFILLIYISFLVLVDI